MFVFLMQFKLKKALAKDARERRDDWSNGYVREKKTVLIAF